MVVHGTFKNGVVVPEEAITIPEGQRVQIVFENEESGESDVSQELLKLSGIMRSGRRDGSVNHDHYIYGAPKRKAES